MLWKWHISQNIIKNQLIYLKKFKKRVQSILNLVKIKNFFEVNKNSINISKYFFTLNGQDYEIQRLFILILDDINSQSSLYIFTSLVNQSFIILSNMNNQKLTCVLCKSKTTDIIRTDCRHYFCQTCVKAKLNKNNILTCTLCGLCTNLNESESKQNNQKRVNTKQLKQRLEQKLKVVNDKNNFQKKKSQIDENHNNCLKRIRHQFNCLKILIQNKQNQIILSIEKSYKQEVNKITNFQQIINQSKSLIFKSDDQNINSKLNDSIEEYFKKLEQIEKYDEQYQSKKIQKLDINIKPIQNMVYNLNVSTVEIKKSQIRQNQRMKENSQKKSEFSRDDSYNRIMAKLNQSKKKISQNQIKFKKDNKSQV